LTQDEQRPATAEARTAVLPQWAPRLPQHKLRRLYATDALGIVDDEAIDDVAWAFYARCDSIITVTDAEHGRVKCPTCGTMIRCRHSSKTSLMACGQCGWQLTWGEYLATYQHRKLSGGSAIGAFQEYVRRLPLTSTPRERMLLIDWLVHQVHKWALDGSELPNWRAAAVNLIEDNLGQVVALLEELAGAPDLSPEIDASAADWRANVLPRLWSPAPPTDRPPL
jgi:predicted RNA-binding Zn-ribbon protein involved in translation (DUF1610 family)